MKIIHRTIAHTRTVWGRQRLQGRSHSYSNRNASASPACISSPLSSSPSSSQSPPPTNAASSAPAPSTPSNPLSSLTLLPTPPTSTLSPLIALLALPLFSSQIIRRFCMRCVNLFKNGLICLSGICKAKVLHLVGILAWTGGFLSLINLNEAGLNSPVVSSPHFPSVITRNQRSIKLEHGDW
uniref:Uncharacterized protein n=1 Tax=Opuntia streptacantha TaxID=393608 RepID=A0A7C9AAM9_OPUST